MQNSILLETLNTKQLQQIVKDSLKNEIDRYIKELTTSPAVELLTRKEACELLRIDQSTLWAWSKAGKVNAYAIANRRYYKRNELIDCLTKVNN